jgi:hypothetical protein
MSPISAALRNADDYWSGGLLIVTMILMGTAILAVVYERGRSQAGWLGYRVFGGAYKEALSVTKAGRGIDAARKAS